VCFATMRQSSGLPANEIIANDAIIKILVYDMTRESCGDLDAEISSLRE